MSHCPPIDTVASGKETPAKRTFFDAMNVVLLLLLTSAAAGLALFFLLTAGFAFARLRGERLVPCPETGEPAAVKLASVTGALAAPFGGKVPSLRSCSRWPERAGCGQECLARITSAPDGCLLRSLAERFYAERRCAICANPFPGSLPPTEHAPALLAADGTTTVWTDLPAEKVPEAFASREPVCWNCHVLRSLWVRRPDLVLVRPAHPDPQQPL
jgi:hypothetical protein